MKVVHGDTIHCDDGEESSTAPAGTRVVAGQLVIEGGPLRYLPPKPVTAEDVERIVREVFRSELAAMNSRTRYWSPAQAALECGVSERTFADWMATGKVQFFKPSRRVLIDPVLLAQDIAKFRRQRTPKRRIRRLEAWS